MPDEFRHMFEGLRETADGLIAANVGIKKVADAALLVTEEPRELRETVGVSKSSCWNWVGK